MAQGSRSCFMSPSLFVSPSFLAAAPRTNSPDMLQSVVRRPARQSCKWPLANSAAKIGAT